VGAGVPHLSSRGSQAGHPHAAHLSARAPSRKRHRQVTVASFEDPALFAAPPSGPTLTVHYYRHDGAAETFGLHVWGTRAARPTTWDAPAMAAPRPAAAVAAGAPGVGPPGIAPAATETREPTWVTFEIPLLAEAASAKPGDPALSFIVHRGDEQCAKVENVIGDLFDESDVFETNASSVDLWIVAGNPKRFKEAPDLAKLPTGDVDLSKARALWVSERCVALPFAVEDSTKVAVELVASADGGLAITDHGSGGIVCEHDHSDLRYVPLEIDPMCWSSPDAGEAGDKYPHVRAAGYTLARIPDAYVTEGYVPWLAKCQLAVQCKDVNVDGSHGRLRDATSVQNHGAVDDVFGNYAGPLGAEINRGGFGGFGGESSVTVRVWAPTARDVRFLLFDRPSGGDPVFETAMRESADGVWTAVGPIDWEGKYYQFSVDVFHPWGGGPAGAFVRSRATDPYSKSLSADGERSHICDLNSPDLKPAGWDDTERWKSTCVQSGEPTDYAIYELHVRDFSAMDESTSWDVRGKYLAFAETNTVPVNHLKSLADAGLTHVHLLPTYDFGSVPERVEWQKTVDHDWLASLPPNSPDQQAAVASVANDDAFNWGYDPVHYGVPEGSYATNPDGATRVLEYRQMVKGLASLGLRTVCDVVYNHTLSAGPTDGRSVLDKVVPGYYHRRDLNGFYENSTCCNNTASENRMMERLIVDDLVHWARTYKVDGFRFDLMGHIMLRTMLRAKEALEQLTLKRDGVDGRKIYLYGEGWDYAEVAHGRVGTNASQINLGGTGIGSFNDRLREGVMGGSPFGDPRVQGVMTGLFFRPNMFIEQGDADEQRKRLVEDNEKVIAAMAGNLREYRFENKDGFQTPGRDACWVGSNVGYAAQPRETVNYVSAHDNETLFDGITLRSAPDVDLETRCRINRLAVATVAFSQGVPFFHAGDEILRSKSLDRDSYNSGDWFNRLDYTGQTHNFGIGLPGREKNGDRYPFIEGLLGDVSLRPDPALIARSVAHFREVLAIRQSTPLFRLTDAEDVQKRVTFYNTGVMQIPGVIVMGVSDDAADGVQQRCAKFNRLLVCVNVTPHEATIADARLATDLAGATMLAHPLQGQICPDDYLLGATCVGGTVVVPGHTACVFVEPR
jgi:pullulanase-type alpha-1,6-glucosidase